MKHSFFQEVVVSILAVWIHYLDANKSAGEEVRRQLHKNAASNIKQVLAATSYKAQTIRPPASHHEKLSKLDEPDMQDTAHMAEQSRTTARIYIQQLCEDTGCSPEDLPEAMNNRKKWRERGRNIRASGTT